MSDKAKADVDKAVSALEVKQAKFELDVQKKLAELSVKEIAVDSKERELAAKAPINPEDLARTQQALGEIGQMVAEFMDQSAEIITGLQEKTTGLQEQTSRPKPKLVSLSAKRVNGKLVAVPTYEGDAGDRPSQFIAERGADGSLTAVPQYPQPPGENS